MWLYMIVGALVLIGVLGGILAGGIFTIALLPLALIILVTGVVFGLWGRSAQGTSEPETENAEPGTRPLPHQGQGEPGSTLSSPEGLADARRAGQ